MDTNLAPSRQDKAVIHIYAALTVSLFLSAVPTGGAVLCSLLLFTGAWIAAGIIKAKAVPGSLAASHTVFIIRTLWIASLLALVSMSIASVWLLLHYDPSPILACIDTGAASIPEDFAALNALMQPCLGPFLETNRPSFMTAAIVGIGPPALYFVARLVRGLLRAVKGHRIGPPDGRKGIF